MNSIIISDYRGSSTSTLTLAEKEKEIEATFGKGTDKAKKERDRAIKDLTEECEAKILTLRQSLDDSVAQLVKVRVLLQL